MTAEDSKVTFLFLFFREIQEESKNSVLTLDDYINLVKELIRSFNNICTIFKLIQLKKKVC